MAQIRGIRFSKAVSYGNAADLDETDFLEYFSRDDETEIIACYIEGVKRGQEFFQILRDVAGRKPVIILKGGCTDAGERAIASHTAALASSDRVWDTIAQQTGAMRVCNLEELADLVLAFSVMPPVNGRRAGVIGMGGGASVQAADDCERAGLIVPMFPDEIQEKLREFTPEAGTGVRNPIDSSPFVVWDPPKFLETMRLVAVWDEIDFLIIQVYVDLGLYRSGPELLREQVEGAIKVRKAYGKPVALVLRASGSPESSRSVLELEEGCQREGIPVYPSIGRAAGAISRVAGYYRRLRDL
jgi:acyl-CoA synthetase (NDP forming)